MTKLEEELAAKVKGLEHMAREMNAENGRLKTRVLSLASAGDEVAGWLKAFLIALQKFDVPAGVRESLDIWEAAKKHG